MELDPKDAEEIEKFMKWMKVEQARQDGADPNACDLLEKAIYPEGVGRNDLNPPDLA